MRVFLYAALFVSILGAQAKAGDVFVSSQDYSGSGTVYNSASGASSYKAAPIPVKSIMRGAQTSGYYSNNSAAPFNLGKRDTGGYTMSLTPDQIRKAQAIDIQRAKAATEAVKKIQEESDKALLNVGSVNENVNSASLGSGLVKSNTQSVAVKQKSVVYNKDANGLTTPQKVFNTIR